MTNKKKLRKLRKNKNKQDDGNAGNIVITEEKKHSKRLEQALSLMDQFENKANLKNSTIGGFSEILFEWAKDGMRRTGRV